MSKCLEKEGDKRRGDKKLSLSRDFPNLLIFHLNVEIFRTITESLSQ